MAETKLLPCHRKGEHCACFEQGQHCCECGWSCPITPDPRITSADEMAKALENVLMVIPSSAEMAILIRMSQSGGEEMNRRCDKMVDDFNRIDPTVDAARAALTAYNALK